MDQDEITRRVDALFGGGPRPQHGFRDAYFDNLAENWRMECLCGFMTSPDFFPLVAEELNDHWTGAENEAREKARKEVEK